MSSKPAAAHIVDRGLAIAIPDDIELSAEQHRALTRSNPEGVAAFEKTHAEVLQAEAEMDALIAARPERREEQNRLSDRIAQQGVLINALVARSLATFYTELKGMPAVSLERLPFEYAAGTSARTNAVQVTLDNVQLPSEVVPWEDLIQLKQDNEYRFHLGRFRSWVSAIAEGSREADLRDQTASSIEEYQRYMKAAGVKVGSGAVSWTIASAAKVAKELLDLKPLSALGTVVSVVSGHSDHRLLEGAAPGTHLSVVSHLNDRYLR